MKKYSFFLVATFTIGFFSCQKNSVDTNSNALLDLASTASELTSELGFSPLTVGCNQNFVNSEKGGEILFENGSKLIIPESAFVDRDGNIVQGKVEVQYTEYNQASKIIAGNLPMTIETENGLGLFESAGMFKIKALFEGEQVEIAPGKAIDVVMKSHKQGEFDFYRLEDGAWTERKEMIASSNPVTPDEESISTELKSIIPKPPIKPRKSNNNDLVFDLKIAQKDVQELVKFEQLMWQTERKEDKPDWLFKQEWDKVKLEQISNEKGVYLMTIEENNEKSQLRVVPVLFGKDYEAALAQYEKDLNAYTKAKSDLSLAQNSRVTTKERTARITSLGTYNWDKLMKQPESLLVSAEFQYSFEQDEKRPVHMVTGPQKLVVNFKQGMKNNMRFSPQVENTLLIISKDSMIYYNDINLGAVELASAKRGEKVFFNLRSSGVKATDVDVLQQFINNI